jgi:preprotein translocase subunit SecD
LVVGATSGALVAGCSMRQSRDIASKGGVRLIFQLAPQPGDSRSADDALQEAMRVLQRRVLVGLHNADGTVQTKGDSELVVELPGEKDGPKAAKALASTSSFAFYWAKNLSTERVDRRYKVDERGDFEPSVILYDRIDEKDVAPKTADGKPNPEYTEIVDGWTPILDSWDIGHADVRQQPGGGLIPAITFTPEGAAKMEKWCRKYMNAQENVAFVLDGVVISVVPLEKGAIIKDRAVIDGVFGPEYVRKLVALLNSGPFVPLKLVSSERIPPQGR